MANSDRPADGDWTASAQTAGDGPRERRGAADGAPDPTPDDPHKLDIVVIGPVGAGKTTLIKSLRHPAETAHSYAGRFTVEALDAAARADGAAPAEAARGQKARGEAASGEAGGSRKRGLLSGLFRGRAPETPPLERVPATPERAFAEAARRGPEDAAAVYARQLRDDVAEGLRGDATAAALAPIPFTLVVREQAAKTRRGAEAIEFAVTAVDTKGGVFAESADDKAEAVRDSFLEEQRAVRERLAQAQAALICLPADEPELDPSRRRAMQTALAQLKTAWAPPASGPPKPRRAVVAITKFERLFLTHGRRGFLAANDRATAGAAASEALSQTWGWLLPRLRELASAPAVSLRVQPVSAFGFIPGDGGANLDPSTGLLRTRPFPEAAAGADGESLLEGPTLDAPYTFEAVFAHYWRPYLVLDPFIQLATGVEGALSFALEADPAAGGRS